MPITKSAQKALRQNAKRASLNRMYEKKIKILVKEISSLIKEKKKEEAKALLSKIYKALDKAAKTNVIKKNTASRKKSRITKQVEKI
ncbi:MAG: 30S ribosomal protein S20 [Candidatus Nealsonbacteria bacterium RIFOXYB1_FULL_40_15]|uniref:Small ribosomal subunit protein bS20 n=2 Tax=Candidatus Nealsoniibacteriota TaxID=1817911 RepID=A0A1G2ETI3_9BACT|nr:MAG: 30S ribosomal protein S20 [Candidatus Nealsonbacteria bacterium RIFOXYB1_FULL_40_15]OGZ29155.1 MAG: 30S ribosomal protein S20 [Candidatus Nealsonbacteria bacterium RIFOXYC1_FULL_40_7]OGZ29707.1 MAG: 30S ribosomal protein S20 [Candidatus Nealsonbacteria bacterium RIFOXYD1_FULL_39_11]